MSTAVRLTFVTAEGRFAGDVPAAGVFHEALEHLLPEALRVGRRVTIRTPAGDAVYPDMFVGETVAHFGTGEFAVRSEPLRGGARPWRTLGVDHLALAVHDRQDARRLLEDGLGMQVVRDDPHQTVLTTGLTAVFLFDATPGPLNPGLPSRVHHLGFVVDDLDAAWQHVRARGYASDYMVLERDERWSLYFFYENGDARFMIQLSEIKAEQRGFDHPTRFTDRMFDYSRHRYGVRFDDRQG
ncbi:MAG TPA: VOC family protein [bacterium]|nr:VOC family protein [bacterium]